MRKIIKVQIVLCLFVFLFGENIAQEQEKESPGAGATSTEELAKANNPLASVKALNTQNYYVPKLNGFPDGYANNLWLRYAMPVGRVFVRVSVPLSTLSLNGRNSSTGLGDIELFGAYLAVSKPKVTFGIGPSITLPTATDDALGTGKYTLGLAAIGFVATPQIQYGGLIQWRASIAGDSDRNDVNVLIVQPLYFFQLGKGLYFRGAPAAVFNLESGDYNVPLGLGIGKVIKIGNLIYNFFVEPQPSILVSGDGQPVFQLFSALNIQF